jgi:S-adenosylmethionine decarboxylase proenzyme
MTDSKLHAIDIRLYITMITVTMALSFLAGAGIFDSTVDAPTPNPTTMDSPMTVRDSYLQVKENTDSSTLLATTSPTNDMISPSGEHLLIDIEGVNSLFLNSEEQLTKAMVGAVTEVGLSMISYHCHSLLPSGVSCVGILVDSHVSFHTWPDEGVITLDLFTCTNTSLLPHIPVMERYFGVGSQARAKWSHELRGFQLPGDHSKHYMNDQSDLSLWVLSPLDLYSKKQIYSGVTDYQRIDIWDIVEVCYVASSHICTQFTLQTI